MGKCESILPLGCDPDDCILVLTTSNGLVIKAPRVPLSPPATKVAQNGAELLVFALPMPPLDGLCSMDVDGWDCINGSGSTELVLSMGPSGTSPLTALDTFDRLRRPIGDNFADASMENEQHCCNRTVS